MTEPNKKNAFEDGWNEVTKTFQNQFSTWIKMSEDYFDYMNDNRKKMIQDFQKQYGYASDNALAASKETGKRLHEVKANVEKATEKTLKKLEEVTDADALEGNWKHLTADIQKQWSKLTAEHLEQVSGSRKKLSDIIQKQYKIAHDEAEKQIKSWEKTCKNLTKSA